MPRFKSLLSKGLIDVGTQVREMVRYLAGSRTRETGLQLVPVVKQQRARSRRSARPRN